MKRVLIANRSEIAFDLISFFKKNNIETVLVCSSDDTDMLPTRAADRIVFTDDNSSIYFDYKKIIDYAIKYKCDAIHPGYGFLATSPELSEMCSENGIIFFGPEYTMLEFARNRAACVQFVKELKINSVESSNIIYNEESAVSAADSLGYPLLIIPNNGYFNYGINYVGSKKKLKNKFNICQKETFSLLKNQEVFFEKFYKNAYSVEVPFVRDHSGKVYVFPEMNTSTQCRFKKIILETPAPFIDDEKRNILYKITQDLVNAFDYKGVGSLEFVLSDNKFYFSNLNPFIPIGYSMYKKTYGIDFPNLQLCIASEKGIDSYLIEKSSYGLEVRIFAENWVQDFKPEPAEITEIIPGFNSIELDVCFYTPLMAGNTLSPYYLPYLGKMVGSSNDRNILIENMITALDNTKFKGTINTIHFLRNLLGTRYFKNGEIKWEFIDSILKKKVFKNYIEESKIASILAAATIAEAYSDNEINMPKKRQSVWNKMGRYTILKNKKL